MNFAFPPPAIDTAIERSAVNSSAFYFRAVNNDWTSPQNDALWRDGVKTLFDPCPSGWRVPKGGEGEHSPWGAFTFENGSWDANGFGYYWNSSQAGLRAWYVLGGHRHYASGYFGALRSEGCAWTTATIDIHSYYLSFFSTRVLPSMHYFRATAYPVRCVRE